MTLRRVLDELHCDPMSPERMELDALERDAKAWRERSAEPVAWMYELKREAAPFSYFHLTFSDPESFHAQGDPAVFSAQPLYAHPSAQSIEVAVLAEQSRNPCQLNQSEDVLEMVKAAVLAEREKCAVVAWITGMDLHKKGADVREVGSACAAAIRARGES